MAAKIEELQKEKELLEQEREFARSNISEDESERAAAIKNAEALRAETASERIVREREERKLQLEEELSLLQEQKAKELTVVEGFL